MPKRTTGASTRTKKRRTCVTALCVSLRGARRRRSGRFFNDWCPKWPFSKAPILSQVFQNFDESMKIFEIPFQNFKSERNFEIRFENFSLFHQEFKRLAKMGSFEKGQFGHQSLKKRPERRRRAPREETQRAVTHVRRFFVRVDVPVVRSTLFWAFRAFSCKPWAPCMAGEPALICTLARRSRVSEKFQNFQFSMRF